jgi:hypothetical protein
LLDAAVVYCTFCPNSGLIHLLVYAFPLANRLFLPTLSEKFLLREMAVEPVVWIRLLVRLMFCFGEMAVQPVVWIRLLVSSLFIFNFIIGFIYYFLFFFLVVLSTPLEINYHCRCLIIILI